MDEYSISRQYETTLDLLKDNISRSFSKSVKTGCFDKAKRIKNSLTGDVYVVFTKEGGMTLFANIDGYWVFSSVMAVVQLGREVKNYNILTHHFIDRYRCRLNMYATPIADVLYDIHLNFHDSTTIHNDRFPEGALYMRKSDVVVPCVASYTHTKRYEYHVTILKTVLDFKDTKTDAVRNRAEEVKVTANGIDNNLSSTN